MRRAAVSAAASEQLARYLAAFEDSATAEALWEDHPELTEAEAEAAGLSAVILATSLRAMLLDLVEQLAAEK